jgi:uncharacterized protein (DUF736 family)
MSRALIGGIWPRSGCASIRLRNGVVDYFPLPCGHSARTKIAALGRPPLCCGLVRCGSLAPGLFDPIKAAMGARLGEPQGETVMAIIGTFTQTGNGLTGSVKTLTLNAKVRFVPVEKDNDKSPDFRIIAGTTNVELGAAWKKTSKEGRPYTSVKLDDPSFPAPIYASLIEAEEGASNLIWSR